MKKDKRTTCEEFQEYIRCLLNGVDYEKKVAEEKKERHKRLKHEYYMKHSKVKKRYKKNDAKHYD